MALVNQRSLVNGSRTPFFSATELHCLGRNPERDTIEPHTHEKNLIDKNGYTPVSRTPAATTYRCNHHFEACADVYRSLQRYAVTHIHSYDLSGWKGVCFIWILHSSSIPTLIWSSPELYQVGKWRSHVDSR